MTGTQADGADPMRILFITEDDPLYVIHFFDVFFDEYPRAELEVAGITISPAFRESKLATARRVLGLYGPVDTVRLGLRFAAAKLRGRSIETLARDASIPILATDSVNDRAYVAKVRGLDPDVIVSVAAPEIFKADLLGSARHGCLNLHSGRLPKYRGMMPTFWQMLHGEDRITITVHEMVPQLDAGSVLATAEEPIRPGDSLARLMIEGKRKGAQLLIGVLRDVAAGSANPQPLATADSDYFSFPTRGHAKELRRRGYSLA